MANNRTAAQNFASVGRHIAGIVGQLVESANAGEHFAAESQREHPPRLFFKHWRFATQKLSAPCWVARAGVLSVRGGRLARRQLRRHSDRKSTRLNSSHVAIS